MRTPREEADRKKAIVAAGIVTCKTQEQIARDAETSVRHVQRLAAQPGMQLLITDLMRPHRAELSRLCKKAIKVVSDALDAKSNRDNPLHEIRLRAVGRLSELLELAQGEIKPIDPERNKPGISWDDLVRAFAEHEAKGQLQ